MRLLCHARNKIISMKTNEILLEKNSNAGEPEWKNVWCNACDQYLQQFDQMFFDVNVEYCVRHMAAAFIFRTEKLWYFSSSEHCNAIKKFILKKLNIIPDRLFEEIKQIFSMDDSNEITNEYSYGTIPDENGDYITNYYYYFHHFAEYNLMFKAARYFSRFSGSNANLERAFSKIKQIGSSTKSSLTTEHFKLLAFVTSNVDLFKLLTRRILPDIEKFCVYDDDIILQMKNRLELKSRKCNIYDEVKTRCPFFVNNKNIRNLRILIANYQIFLQVHVWQKRLSYCPNKKIRIPKNDISIKIIFGKNALEEKDNMINAIKAINCQYNISINVKEPKDTYQLGREDDN